MKAFSLFNSSRSAFGGMRKESVWTEVLKKDLVVLLDAIECRSKKGGKFEVTRINEDTLYIHRIFNKEENSIEGVFDTIYTIEEVTL